MVAASLTQSTLAFARRTPACLSSLSASTSSISHASRALHSTSHAFYAATTPALGGMSPSTTRATPPPIEKPQDFVSAISRPRRADLNGIIEALGGEGATLDDLKALDGLQLKKSGVPVKERRYILWCLERFRQGQHPALIAYDAKPKKKIRGWGPRVQNGIRVRGVKQPGEK